MPSFVRTAALWLNRRVRRFLIGIRHPETVRKSHTLMGRHWLEISAATSDHRRAPIPCWRASEAEAQQFDSESPGNPLLEDAGSLEDSRLPPGPL